ncbi:uncharacterized protein LOC132944808 [Metopolophium dirhodum]|uniref:uncharacterized protein LOC132944808 n=1 Tax=Metopolophium dirhodum TaxID=44670 RepID=UPI00298F5804|nr:uncharacterized protein LOC132944808 [Metopolophium dirhodum]
MRCHGLSYTDKYKDPDRFQEIIMDIRDTNFDVDGQWLFKNYALSRFGKRGVDQQPTDGDNSLRRALVLREPFSVVCHGDFNRNNVLFRYDEARHLVDVLLFDFGTTPYGSPTLDLSFFFYMNTTQDLRESRWDDLLNPYCLTLAESVPSGVRVPNSAELNSEMAMYTYYGFAHALFYLHHQLETNAIELSSSKEINDEDVLELYLEVGGDIGSDILADMVQHIVDMEYTNQYFKELILRTI